MEKISEKSTFLLEQCKCTCKKDRLASYCALVRNFTPFKHRENALIWDYTSIKRMEKISKKYTFFPHILSVPDREPPPPRGANACILNKNA